MTDLASWIGRQERSSEVLDEPLARRWLSTFDLPPLDTGPMPQGIHWCLCGPDTPTAKLGPDGHPARNGGPSSFLPPAPGPRRMWAGSACEFLAPLKVGDLAERTSKVETVEEKQGRSGALTFVSVLHETTVAGRLAVRERQTLVYRDAPPPGLPPAPPPPDGTAFETAGWDRAERIRPDMPLLFRYSALTFNTHRIHYDTDYVREVENYRGPVVHGPLIASLLLQLASQQFGGNVLASFAFRAVSPAVAGEELVLTLRGGAAGIDLGAFAQDGREIVRASAALRTE